MSSVPESERFGRAQKLIADLEALEQEAYRLDKTITARAINNAKNAAGWEMAGNTACAGKAARGER